MSVRHSLPRSILPLLAGLAALLATPVFAHHGTSVNYDPTRTVTVTGTVVEYRWRNPHTILSLEVTDEAGNPETFTIELPSPIMMSRTSGWTRDTFEPGDVVEFTGYPSRTGAPVAACLFMCEVLINGEPPENPLRR